MFKAFKCCAATLCAIATLLAGCGTTQQIAPALPVADMTDCKDCPPMIRIPGTASFISGQLTLGANQMAEQAGPITLKPFYISQAEITLSQYRAFLTDSRYWSHSQGCLNWVGSSFIGLYRWQMSDLTLEKPGFEQSPRSPVVCVSPADATAYVAWLSTKTGHTYRLPVATELEYLARGAHKNGTYLSDNLEDPEICKYENLGPRERRADWHLTCHDDEGEPMSVGSLHPGPFGLYDLLGNVREYVLPFFDQAQQRRFPGFESYPSPAYGIKGGSYLESNPSIDPDVTEIIDASDAQVYRAVDVGFRVVAMQ